MELRAWLAEQRVTVVAVEATGDYWKPVYYLLEDQFEVQLLNAAHMRNVPARRCVRDYETLPAHHEAMIHLAMIMSRRLARTGDW